MHAFVVRVKFTFYLSGLLLILCEPVFVFPFHFVVVVFVIAVIVKLLLDRLPRRLALRSR